MLGRMLLLVSSILYIVFSFVDGRLVGRFEGLARLRESGSPFHMPALMVIILVMLSFIAGITGIISSVSRYSARMARDIGVIALVLSVFINLADFHLGGSRVYNLLYRRLSFASIEFLVVQVIYVIGATKLKKIHLQKGGIIMEEKGILVSNNGKGNTAQDFWRLIYLWLAVAGGILIYISRTVLTVTERNFWGSPTIVRHPMAGFVLYLGIFAIAGGLIDVIAKCFCIGKTEINVYADFIEGTGVGKYFMLGAYSTKQFKLTYDQITSVDSTKSSLTIHAHGTSYKCYVKNSAEIQKIIFDLRK